MSKKSEMPKYNNPESTKERLLGKRHDYGSAGPSSFKATASAIGFSAEELKRLGRVYFGTARPEPFKKHKRD